MPSPALPDIEYTYLLEVKYAKKDDPKTKIDALRQEAIAQLTQYAADPLKLGTLPTSKAPKKLKLIYVIFRTWELEEMDEIFVNTPC